MSSRNITHRRGGTTNKNNGGNGPSGAASLLPPTAGDLEAGRMGGARRRESRSNGENNPSETRTRRRRRPWTWHPDTSSSLVVSTAGRWLVAIALASAALLLLILRPTSLPRLPQSFVGQSQRTHLRDDDTQRFKHDRHDRGELTSPKGGGHATATTTNNTPLETKFPSLSYALKHSSLVALYFAASWCPMSTPISEALDVAFGEGSDVLSMPPPSDAGREARGGVVDSEGDFERRRRKPLSIVYVSSDKTSDEFRGYARKHWNAVPFDSPDRSRLKRHFGTCAWIEIEELGIDRKHEIPTLIILDGVTGGILTTGGAKDLMERGDMALGHWRGLQTLIHETAQELSQNTF